jgi:DNA-binding Lrp family transcriptional regulator
VYTAYILINSDVGSESSVLKEIKNVEGVEEAFATYGVYDIIVKVASDSMEELKRIITWKIRKMDGIKATLTLMGHESGSQQMFDETPITL